MNNMPGGLCQINSLQNLQWKKVSEWNTDKAKEVPEEWVDSYLLGLLQVPKCLTWPSLIASTILVN